MKDFVLSSRQHLRRVPLRGFIALFALLFVETTSLRGAEHGDRTIVLSFENDSFGGTDRHYTHGMRVAYYHRGQDVPEEDALSKWSRGLWKFEKLGLDSFDEERFGIAIGQNLYTPANLRLRNVIAADRPYAGWLYTGLIFQRTGMKGRISVLDQLELDLGVVGPESLAEKTQKWWHDMFNFTTPQGWNNQLRDEPGFVLSLDRAYRFPLLESLNGWRADLIPDIGVALGNVVTYGNLGLQFRVGYNLPGNFGGGNTGTIRPSAVEMIQSPKINSHTAKWGIYGFSGIEGRAVARNIFLDGNTWRRSHSVDKKFAVADLKIGAALWFKKVSLSYTYVYRTREFDTQLGEDKFGSVSVGIQF